MHRLGEVVMKHVFSILSVVILLLFVIPFHSNHLIVEASQPQTLEVKGDTKAGVIKQLGDLPAFFIENQGQTAEEVRYYFKGSDTVYFTDSGVVFQKIEGISNNREIEHGTDSDNNANNADPEQVTAQTDIPLSNHKKVSHS